MRNDNKIPKNEEEILSYIDQSAEQLDEQRLAGLKELQDTQLVKEEVLQREKKRLETKHGETHPEVKNAENRLRYNKEMFVGLKKEIERASVKTESINKTSWRVHGRVFDSGGNPVKGVTVFLSDRNKKWIEILGSSCTNELGYYALTADEKIIARVAKDQPLFLSVSDKNKKLLYMATEPVMAVAGIIVYQDIYLNQEDCVTPPKDNKDYGINKPTETEIETERQKELDKAKEIEKQKELDKAKEIERQKDLDKVAELKKQKEIDAQREIEKQKKIADQKARNKNSGKK